MKNLIVALSALVLTACGTASKTAATVQAYACTPTPHVDGTTIMPLGDSITYGYGDPLLGGYRDLLAQDLGPGFTFIGSQVDPQGQHNEGHPGWTTKNEATQNGLYEQIDCWLGQSQPSIVLLMIGTNTLAFRLPADAQTNANMALSDLNDLVARIHQVSPASKIYLASIVSLSEQLPWEGVSDLSNVPSFQDAINAYNTQLPGFVSAQQAQGLDITFVDVNSAVSTVSTNYHDMIHPTTGGYTEMEGAWLNALNH